MPVGQDVTVAGDDHARAEPVLARREGILAAGRAAGALLAEETLEQIVIVRRLLVRAGFGGDEHLDDARGDFLDDGSEAAGRGAGAVHGRVLDLEFRLCGLGGLRRGCRIGQRERGARSEGRRADEGRGEGQKRFLVGRWMAKHSDKIRFSA